MRSESYRGTGLDSNFLEFIEHRGDVAGFVFVAIAQSFVNGIDDHQEEMLAFEDVDNFLAQMFKAIGAAAQIPCVEHSRFEIHAFGGADFVYAIPKKWILDFEIDIANWTALSVETPPWITGRDRDREIDQCHCLATFAGSSDDHFASQMQKLVDNFWRKRGAIPVEESRCVFELCDPFGNSFEIFHVRPHFGEDLAQITGCFCCLLRQDEGFHHDAPAEIFFAEFADVIFDHFRGMTDPGRTNKKLSDPGCSAKLIQFPLVS